MAFIYPFRGFRYRQDVVGDIDNVIAQPYDKTTPAMQDAYYQRSPYNVVRITLNLEKRENAETVYPEAGATFQRWIAEKILEQDSLPAIYAYYQEHLVDGDARLQRGFIALLDLKQSESGIIPHEQTLAAPKQDRLRLMRSLEGNEDLIYMLYSDDALSVNRVLDSSIAGKAPDIEVADEYGARHRVWSVADPEAIREIQTAMQSRELFIADGHHRFETSVNFMKECEQRKWSPEGVESFDKRMIACFNVADGVTILPTHRLIRDLPSFDAPSLLRAAGEHFDVDTLPSAAALWKRMKESRAHHVIGFYPADLKDFYLLRLKTNVLESLDDVHRLDVSILHTLLLERCMGIDDSKLIAQSHVDYERDGDACIRKVHAGEYQAAFFLNPTTAAQMQAIASHGKRMPQKSTDFYPKLLTGLVFMKMQIRKQ